MLLIHGEFTWIPHALSIIDEETHNLQKMLKTIYRVFVSRVDAVPRFIH